ncbi:histidinol dehydrogenase [Buchnera aphidicola]|uniref:histidinol dehydrogenase n=1 Tax=Buchnera aphidicola TaxID=9 RepID=UPI0031B7F765
MVDKLLNVIHWNQLNEIDQKKILVRPAFSTSNKVVELVKKIILDVKMLGDSALKKYSYIFDHSNLNTFQVSDKKILDSHYKVKNNVKDAILKAIENIKIFHAMQQMKIIDIEVQSGINCQQIIKPIESVGLYIPGGLSPLVSTVLMLSIPAQIAQCPNIFICSPPPITNEILYAAKVCGVHKVFEIGGAQAIAAFAFGTKSIPKVNKIFGPGNIYVTEAKRQVNQLLNNLAIDMLAGPSELLIIADSMANPIFVAADLLSQLEHGPDSQVVLVTPSIILVQEVLQQLKKQLQVLSHREIIKKTLKKSFVVITSNLIECTSISNLYAPEHLIINTINPEDLLCNIINAGSIFLGNWSPEAAGDYASGPNHVLPTYGCAAVYSGVGVIDFQKRISVQKLTKEGLISLSSTILTLSNIEKLEAHYNAIKLRLD